jgi:MFS transporter, PPP family, 3-phenylpropionic acid transporter
MRATAFVRNPGERMPQADSAGPPMPLGQPARSTVVFFAIYAAMYGAFGVASPFWPRFFELRGLSAEEIGILLGCGTFTRLIAGPLAGRLADATGRRDLVLATCMGFAAAFAVMLILPSSFLLLLCAHILQAAALAPVTSIADALALGGAARNGFEYGRLRGAGSGAFVLGTLAAGFAIGGAGLDLVPWTHAGLLLAAAALVLCLRDEVTSAHGSFGSIPAGGFRELWREATFRRVVLVAALVYGSHAVHDAFAMIRWNAAGLGPSLTAILWSEAVVAEVVMFFLIGPWLIARLGVHGAAALAAAMGVVRWIVMGSTTSAVAVAIVQPLHGLTFALMHLACMRIITVVVPSRLAATAQAAYALGGGLASVALTVLAGPLYGHAGGGAFIPMAALCAIAVPLAWTGFRVPPRDVSR